MKMQLKMLLLLIWQMGGSSNTVLHMLVIAKEASVNFELKI